MLATDAAGAVVWAARYLPFGGIDQVSVDTGALTQNLRFPGQWFQVGEPDQKSLRGSDFPANGLHQNWMRDYDPTTGRYLQADPLGLVDGPSVYGYARQSPGRFVDPRGLYCIAGPSNVSCSVPGIDVDFTVPNPSPGEWPQSIAPGQATYHHYDVETFVKNPGLCECLKKKLERSPTTGEDSPATEYGTLNQALPLGLDPVLTYSLGDGTIVNVTLPNHKLKHGYVFRKVTCTPTGVTIRSIGEGNSIIQAIMPFSNAVAENVWDSEAEDIICECGGE